MEATLPASGGIRPDVDGRGAGTARKEACRLPLKKAAVAAAHAPSVTLPLRFILTGTLSLFAVGGFLVVRPDLLASYHYNQYVVAVTHLLVLGWITSVVMGAMYQLVPVALETRLHSEKLARWHFWLHLVGFLGMVWMFWVWDLKQVGHFGSVFALGVFLFAGNLARTLVRIPRWNVIAFGIASALFWLVMTTLAGLFLASAKCWPQISPFHPVSQMHAHAHLGGLGCFVMMIVGISFKVVPMFALSEVQSHRRAGWSIGLLNVGVAGLFLTILFDSAWKLAFALVTAAALLVYGIELAAILRARKRRQLDWGLKYFLAALSLLAPLAALGVLLCWPGLPATALTTQLENVYGLMALMGVVTLAMLGMLYKIVPFLVWYASYSRELGRGRVPSLAELYSTRLQALGFWTFVAGLSAAAVTTALGHRAGAQASAVVLATALGLFAVNMGKILTHYVRPRVQRFESKALAEPVS